MVEAGLQTESFASDGDEHIDAHGDPDLGLHGVLAGAIERLDSQVLLNPLEEQFHVTVQIPMVVDFRGGGGWARAGAGDGNEPQSVNS